MFRQLQVVRYSCQYWIHNATNRPQLSTIWSILTHRKHVYLTIVATK